ncbi:hypothetical protein BDB01DRAFT_795192 [Pilobolus umbonatus]|nr:hypothetical protein BDB01DRAFT_795192 [Pilobolus umbonatus]
MSQNSITANTPTSSTPLLGDRPKIRGVQRVPTFFKSSIPNRRSLLKAFIHMAVNMLFELVLPILLYYVLRNFVSPLLALLMAGIPTAIIVIVKAIRDGKPDMLGILMLLGFVVSGILAFVQSDPKLYLLRESAMTLALGLMLMITLFPLQYRNHILRPFMFYVARQIAVSSNAVLTPNSVYDHWDLFWRQYPSFRHSLVAITGIWSAGLISEFIVKYILITEKEDVDDIVYYSNIYMLIVMIFLGTFTVTSALLMRHYFNLKQRQIKTAERKSEVEFIIARAAAEQLQKSQSPV